MTTVVYLKERKPDVPDFRGSLPMTRMLNELSRESAELANDWLFEMASPEVKRQMLAEHGLKVAA